MAMAEVKNSLPERINVMRVITYDVSGICEQIHNTLEKSLDEITIEDCMNWIEDWVNEDFNGYTDELIYQDENGDDL
jgi:hypothetical protein